MWVQRIGGIIYVLSIKNPKYSEKNVVPLRPLQIQHGLAWNRTRVSAVRCLRLSHGTANVFCSKGASDCRCCVVQRFWMVVSCLLFELQIWNTAEAAFLCCGHVFNTNCHACDGHRIVLFIRFPFQLLAPRTKQVNRIKTSR
jgi:hypothetical protein